MFKRLTILLITISVLFGIFAIHTSHQNRRPQEVQTIFNLSPEEFIEYIDYSYRNLESLSITEIDISATRYWTRDSEWYRNLRSNYYNVRIFIIDHYVQASIFYLGRDTVDSEWRILFVGKYV